jgi:hypothetical protein
MDKAYSLINRRILPAAAITYRENIGRQIICHMCGEPVFKKEMRVEARQEKTHFLSHYAGDPTTCKERAKGANKKISDKEKKTQLQHLSEFNNIFREQITKSFQKIVSKKKFEENKNNLNIAKKIAIDDLETSSIKKLISETLSYINEKLETRFGDQFSKLDEALIYVNKHLNSQFGLENLKFLTCVAVIISYRNTNLLISEMLKQKNIKEQKFFSEKLFIATKKLLASYINWIGPIEKIDSFLNKKKINLNASLAKSSHGSKQKNLNTSASKVCTTCKKVVGKIYLKCPYCLGKLKNETNVKRQIRISKEKVVLNKPKKQKAKALIADPLGIEEVKFCEFCGKYSYTGSLECPACLRKYRNLVSLKSDVKASNLKNISYSNDTDSSLSKFEEKQYCAICKIRYFSSTPNTCPYCFNKDKKIINPKNSTVVNRKIKSNRSWLENQPWDEENLKAHQKLKGSN